MPKSTDDIVFALCHELGNLVGAIRLGAHLIDGEASPVELANLSVEIDDSSERIHSLLALVRPLLAGGDAAGVEPADLVAGVAEALDDYGGHGAGLEVKTTPELPAVRGRANAVHHLLSSFAYYAVEGTRPRGHVVLEACLGDAGDVVFRIEDDGPEEPGLGEALDDQATRRTLLCEIATVILARWGGTVRTSRVGDTTRIELVLPAR